MMNQRKIGLIGQRMRERRDRLGLSQEDLAQALGQKQNAIYRWEAEKVDPSSFALMRLAEELEVPADYLIGLRDDTGESKEQQELTPEERRLLWMYKHGLTLELIEELAGIARRRDQD